MLNRDIREGVLQFHKACLTLFWCRLRWWFCFSHRNMWCYGFRFCAVPVKPGTDLMDLVLLNWKMDFSGFIYNCTYHISDSSKYMSSDIQATPHTDTESLDLACSPPCITGVSPVSHCGTGLIHTRHVLSSMFISRLMCVNAECDTRWASVRRLVSTSRVWSRGLGIIVCLLVHWNN